MGTSSGPSAAPSDWDGLAGRPRTGADNPALRQLRADLGDDSAVDHFVADFVGLLDDRLAGLHHLLARRRIEAVVTALLTIETSSVMVGADRLAAGAKELREAFSSDTSAVPGLLERLEGAARVAKRELTDPG